MMTICFEYETKEAAVDAAKVIERGYRGVGRIYETVGQRVFPIYAKYDDANPTNVGVSPLGWVCYLQIDETFAAAPSLLNTPTDGMLSKEP